MSAKTPIREVWTNTIRSALIPLNSVAMRKAQGKGR
jgi:hypothetical protein